MVATKGFVRMDEETIVALLADNALVSTAHIRGAGRLDDPDPAPPGAAYTGDRPLAGAVRGEGLLRKIRFPLMQREYLEGLSVTSIRAGRGRCGPRQWWGWPAAGWRRHPGDGGADHGRLAALDGGVSAGCVR